MSKPILCLDFDGVIHSYTSGWKGADVIPDPPVPGAIEFIFRSFPHFTVAIYSSRSGQAGGIEAMKCWLLDWVKETDFKPGDWTWPETLGEAFHSIQWPTEKPPAMVTIDDRALTFNGNWTSYDPLTLLMFQPWNKKPLSALGKAVRDARGSDAPPTPKQGFA